MAGTQVVVAGNIIAIPNTANFGSIKVGEQSAFQQITLENQDFYGASSINITVSSDFVINDNCLTSMVGGGTCTVNVAFAPTLVSTYNGWVRVDYIDDFNGGQFMTQIDLSAVGLPADKAELTVTPATLDFGLVQVGQSSAPQPVIIENTGTANLQLDSLVVGNQFSGSNDCAALNWVLVPAASCTVSMSFFPTEENDAVEQLLQVTGVDINSQTPLSASVSMLGVATPAPSASLTVTPNTLNFAPLPVGQSSAAQPVVIENTGAADLQLDPLVVGDQFSETNDCAALNWILVPAASCTASVTFIPTEENDNVEQSLQVTGLDINSKTQLSASVPMLGIATPALSASLTVTPNSLNFGAVGLNESSAPQPVTVSNTGTGPMDLNPLTVSGEFSQSGDCGSITVLDAGANCLVNVVFNPLTGGSLVGLLSVSGLDQGSGKILSSHVELEGFGLDISLEASPVALSFSGTLPQAVSDVQLVTISNASDVDLVLDQLLVSDSFMRTGGDCGGSLAPNASCMVEIAFAPQEAGSFDGELLIGATDSSGGVSVSNIVSLSGRTMGQATAESILMQVDVGDNPNVISVIGVIADTCTSGRASPRLQEDCNAVIEAADAGDQGVITALNEVTPERAIKSSRLTQQGGQVQMSNVASRIAALRSGATGISFGGLGFDINGKQLSATQLASQGQANARGGSAGEDDGMFGSRLGGFVTGTISTGDKEGTDLDSGLDFSTSGITAGLDYRLTDTLVLGGAIGYMSTDSNLDNSGGNVDASGYTLTAYGTYYGAQSYYVDFSAAYGSNSFDQQRKVAYVLQNQGIIDQKAKADYDGDMFTFSVGTGYDFHSGGWTFGPRANLDYIKADVDGFTEKMSDPLSSGGGWATSIEDTDQTWLTLKMGGKLAYAYSASWGVLTPYAGADWLHEFQNDSQLILGGFAEDPGSLNFGLRTEDPDRNYFRVNFGVAAVFQNGIIGFVDYDTILSNDRWDRQTISAGLRMEF